MNIIRFLGFLWLVLLTSVVSARDLKEGMSGPDVQKWQLFLIERGYLEPPALGNFAKRTLQATIAFQKSQGLGVVGPKTIAKAKRFGFSPVSAVSSKGAQRVNAPNAYVIRLSPSQKDAARRAIYALEEVDKWIKYHPSKSVIEFKQRSDEAAYVVNESLSAIPNGVIKVKLKKAADGFRAIAAVSEMLVSLGGLSSTTAIELRLAALLSSTRQNIQDARMALSRS